MDLFWRWKRMAAMEAAELYEILKLRQDIFVIEQSCIYPDLDNRDTLSWHLSGLDADGALAAYLRVIPADARNPLPRIGRVAVPQAHRGKGLARALVSEGIRRTHALHPGSAIRISAQEYLVRFYGSLGFEARGNTYLEDGIPHVDMILPSPASPPGPSAPA